jgi:hypothetical protein
MNRRSAPARAANPAHFPEQPGCESRRAPRGDISRFERGKQRHRLCRTRAGPRTPGPLRGPVLALCELYATSASATMTRAIPEPTARDDVFRVAYTVLLGTVLVALGFAWAAAGLMVLGTVVTVIMSAPSLLLSTAAFLAVVAILRAIVRAHATPGGGHGPRPTA